MTKEQIEILKKKYKGKRVLIVGLGLQGGGVGLAEFFCELGAQVTVTDKKSKEQLIPSLKKLANLPVEFNLGGHKIEDFLSADIIFKGPSVSWDLLEIKEAQKKKIPVEMEIPFFVKHCQAKIIGVTGTRGKSTTASLIFQILKNFNFSVYLAGNLSGVSTINLLKTISKDDWIVLELSSWALSGFHKKKISTHIAVFTSFYPDHLNYYKDLNDYLYDKKAIFLYQKDNDYLVINRNLKKIIPELKKRKNVFYFSKNDYPYNMKILKGSHNQENAAAAFLVARILNLDEKKTIDIINSFKGLPYRQEIVRKKNGVIFVNDATSTTPIATIKAIENFLDKPIYLILGGNSKNLPWIELIPYLKKVKKIILLEGTFTDEILPSLKKIYPQKITKIHKNLSQAIFEAYNFAKNEKSSCYVIFSPAATSFSLFNNEFERGKEFNRVTKFI